MTFLFRQTRTRIHTQAAEKHQREHGYASAARAMAAVQLGAQLLLWIFFFAYDRSAQAVWQAAALLVLPLGALWLLWRGASVDHPAARWWALLLFPCLLGDAALITAALGGFISQLVPQYPAWVSLALPLAACWFTALSAKARGVRYGSLLLCAALVILFTFGTVFLRASTRADRLWPILGDGWLSTLRTGLTGAGAVWAAALLFVLPNGPAKLKSAGWAAVPLGLGVICGLWFGFLKPWLPGDVLTVAEKMMGLARHAHSMILYEMTGILWMLLLPAALTACFATGEELLARAFPQLKRWLALLPLPALTLAAALIWPENILTALGWLLPWRIVPALVCGAGLFWLKWRAR